MVKGLSRKVIIVKSPDPQIFEQAIFILKDDYLANQCIDQKTLMRQAQRAANGYVSQSYNCKNRNLSKLLIGGALFFGITALLAAAALTIV